MQAACMNQHSVAGLKCPYINHLHDSNPEPGRMGKHQRPFLLSTVAEFVE